MKHILLFIALSISAYTLAQKKPEVTFEEMKAKCEAKPLADRVKMSVTRFDVTASGADRELGKNMQAQLTNALQQINCFRILESLSNRKDLTQEIDQKNSKYSASDGAAETGKMLGAQVVVTGEITEFAKNKNSKSKGGLIGVSKSTETLAFGFILKIINPETRDVLWSESINVEGKSSSTKLSSRRIPFTTGNSSSSDKAVADALEKGVFTACERIVDQIDNIELPEVSNLTVTTVTYRDGDFMKTRAVAKKLEALEGVESVKSRMDEGNAQIIISHSGTIDNFLDKSVAVLTTEGKVVDMTSTTITLE